MNPGIYKVYDFAENRSKKIDYRIIFFIIFSISIQSFCILISSSKLKQENQKPLALYFFGGKWESESSAHSCAISSKLAKIFNLEFS